MTDLQSSVTLAGHFFLCRTKRSGSCLMGLWVCGMDGYDQIPLPMNRWLTQITLVGPGGPSGEAKALTMSQSRGIVGFVGEGWDLGSRGGVPGSVSPRDQTSDLSPQTLLLGSWASIARGKHR